MRVLKTRKIFYLFLTFWLIFPTLRSSSGAQFGKKIKAFEYFVKKQNLTFFPINIINKIWKDLNFTAK